MARQRNVPTVDLEPLADYVVNDNHRDVPDKHESSDHEYFTNHSRPRTKPMGLFPTDTGVNLMSERHPAVWHLGPLHHHPLHESVYHFIAGAQCGDNYLK